MLAIVPVVASPALAHDGCGVEMRIYDGQGDATAAPALRGGATVLNRIDTNGNREMDLTEREVPGEVDLMRLELLPPTYAPGSTPDSGGTALLEVRGGPDKVRFWEAPEKATELVPVAGPFGPQLTFPEAALPKTVWIEGVQQSDVLRDVSLFYGIQHTHTPGADPYVWCSTAAVATIVWAKWTDAAFNEDDRDSPSGQRPRWTRTSSHRGTRSTSSAAAASGSGPSAPIRAGSGTASDPVPGLPSPCGAPRWRPVRRHATEARHLVACGGPQVAPDQALRLRGGDAER